MTQADDRLLESLEGSNMVLSPRILAVNTDYSRHYVSERLAILLDAQLVEKEDEGLYRITERGKGYLSGEVEAKTLEDATD
ncbi:MarR family transcriptional regulator [Halovenus marina]|uniref:MarR family transcriptional regulator n=1 Tax=Halovenus marina TaxID=3396621 RepID=UPI003F57F917